MTSVKALWDVCVHLHLLEDYNLTTLCPDQETGAAFQVC